MALYMTQFSYTTEAWQAMVKNPQDRSGVLKNLIEKLDGRLIGLYFCFGEYDGVAIYEYLRRCHLRRRCAGSDFCRSSENDGNNQADTWR